MNLPILSAAAESSPYRNQSLEKFETALRLLMDGLAEHKIWNVDYEAAKHTLNGVWEMAEEKVHDPLRTLYYRNDLHLTWDSNDPRYNMGLVSLLNAGGYLKKLMKVKNAPELKPYMDLMAEGAQIGDLMKSVKPYIVKGRKPSENPVEKDYTNTGHCGVCGRRQKLTFDGRLVDHGFNIDKRNWGGRSGICQGKGYKAFELSPEGAVAYIETMKKQLARTEEALSALKAGKYKTFSEVVKVRKPELGFGKYEEEMRVWEKGTPQYEKLLATEIFKAEQQIGYLNDDIETFTERVANWVEKPLEFGGAETQERWKPKS